MTLQGIIILIVIIFIIVIIVKDKLNKRFIKEKFEDSNIIVFGKKGSGKDLLFQLVINLRKKKHYSNIVYNKKTEIICIDQLSVSPNTYELAIQGKFIVVPKIFEESTDAYISDGGIFLPSQYDHQLDRQFPSFPIFYALSRHLYKSNIHINTQSLTRVWKKIREQADGYFKTAGVINFGPWLFLRVRYYDKYETAEANMSPLASRFMNKYARAEADQYLAMHGLIKDMFVFIPKKSIHYSTRYFHDVFFGLPAPVRGAGKKKLVSGESKKEESK